MKKFGEKKKICQKNFIFISLIYQYNLLNNIRVTYYYTKRNNSYQIIFQKIGYSYFD